AARERSGLVCFVNGREDDRGAKPMPTAAPAPPTAARSRHWYPIATTGRPHPLWYFGWAAYVNRYGYLRALAVGLPVAGGLAAAGLALRVAPLLTVAGLL